MFQNNSFFSQKRQDKTQQQLAALNRKQRYLEESLFNIQSKDNTAQLQYTISQLNQKLEQYKEDSKTDIENTRLEIANTQTALQEELTTLTEQIKMNEKKIERLILQGTDISKKVNALFKSFLITRDNVANLYTQIRLSLRIKR